MLKKGEEVKIKSWEEIIKIDNNFSLIVESMEHQAGKKGRITNIRDWRGSKIFEVRDWWWKEEMFDLPPKSKNKQYLLGF